MTDARHPVRAKRELEYGPLELVRGDIFNLAGLPNDALLIEHKYVVPIAEPVIWCACGLGFLTALTHRQHTNGECEHPVVRRLINATRDDAAANPTPTARQTRRFLKQNPPT